MTSPATPSTIDDLDAPAPSEFNGACCVALSLPVLSFGLSVGAVYVADMLNLLDFHLLYAMGLQVGLLVVFTGLYAVFGFRGK